MAVNSSLHSQAPSCNFPLTTFIMSGSLVLLILMIPLLGFVLVVGFQRWRKQPFSSAFATSSHIDMFTYNVALVDLLTILGTYFSYFGTMSDEQKIMNAGNGMLAISSTGHTLFHLLTCIERYLAVVHPIFYLRLRGSAGVRIRNITIGCVWLISVCVMSLSMWLHVSFVTLFFIFLSLTTVAFCFCTVSVLCALIRPGPGEGGGDNRLSNQSKQRAFHTMAMITGTLSLMFFSTLTISMVQTFSIPYGYTFCVVGCSSVLFIVPSYLVLPLLFLQRMGKLKVCGHKPDEAA